MESAHAAKEDEEEKKKAFRCYQQDGAWFCETEDLRLGPINCLYETVMGEFKHQEREICEPQLSAELNALA